MSKIVIMIDHRNPAPHIPVSIMVTGLAELDPPSGWVVRTRIL